MFQKTLTGGGGGGGIITSQTTLCRNFGGGGGGGRIFEGGVLAGHYGIYLRCMDTAHDIPFTLLPLMRMHDQKSITCSREKLIN